MSKGQEARLFVNKTPKTQANMSVLYSNVRQDMLRSVLAMNIKHVCYVPIDLQLDFPFRTSNHIDLPGVSGGLDLTQHTMLVRRGFPEILLLKYVWN